MFTITSGAIILIPTWLMSLGVVQSVDALVYRTIWWAFGHSSQQINVAAHISIWYAVAIAFGAKPMSERGAAVRFPALHPVPSNWPAHTICWPIRASRPAGK